MAVAMISLMCKCCRNSMSLSAGRFLPDSKPLLYAADFPGRRMCSTHPADHRSDRLLPCNSRRRTQKILLHTASLRQFWHYSWKAAVEGMVLWFHIRRCRCNCSNRCSSTAGYASRQHLHRTTFSASSGRVCSPYIERQVSHLGTTHRYTEIRSLSHPATWEPIGRSSSSQLWKESRVYRIY